MRHRSLWSLRSLGERIAVAALLLAGMSAGLTACDYGASSAATFAPGLSASGPAPTVTEWPTAAPTPTITPTLTAYSPPCLVSQLQFRMLPQGAGAGGRASSVFIFTNVGANACSLRGFPNARLLDSAGRTISVKIVQASQAYMWPYVPVNTIEMPHGGAAYFMTEQHTENQYGQPCIQPARTLIFPPGASSNFAGFVSPRNLGSCDDSLVISPVAEWDANY